MTSTPIAQNLWDVLPTPLALAWRELRFAHGAGVGHQASVLVERMLQFAGVIEFARLSQGAALGGDGHALTSLQKQLSRRSGGEALSAGGWYHLLLETWKAQDRVGVAPMARPPLELLKSLIERRNDAVHRNDLDEAMLHDLGDALGQFGVFTAGRLVWFSGQSTYADRETRSPVRVCVGADSKGHIEELRWRAPINVEQGLHWMNVGLTGEQVLVSLHGLIECPSLPSTTNAWRIAAALQSPPPNRAAKAAPFPWSGVEVAHGLLDLAEHRMTGRAEFRTLERPVVSSIPGWSVAAQSVLRLRWHAEAASPHLRGATQRVDVGTTGAPVAAPDVDEWTGSHSLVSGAHVQRLARFPFFVAVIGFIAGVIAIVVNLVGGSDVSPTANDAIAPAAASAAPDVAPRPPSPTEPAAAPVREPAVAPTPEPAPTPTIAAPTQLRTQTPESVTATPTGTAPSITRFSTSVCTYSNSGSFRYYTGGSNYRMSWGTSATAAPSTIWRRFRQHPERVETNPELLRSTQNLMLLRTRFCPQEGCHGSEQGEIVYFAVQRAADRTLDGFYLSNFGPSGAPLLGAVGDTTNDCSSLNRMNPALTCMLNAMLAQAQPRSDYAGRIALIAAFDRCAR